MLWCAVSAIKCNARSYFSMAEESHMVVSTIDVHMDVYVELSWYIALKYVMPLVHVK